MKSIFFRIVAMVIAGSVLAACGDIETGSVRLVVKLTDAPGDYQEVNVDIQSIEINVSENGYSNGWVSLDNVNTGVYNLLELTNGLSVVLADVEFPAGFIISQIRLVLGEKNTLKVNDQFYDLKTPSAQQSGLKVQLNSALAANPWITYMVHLDFDAARSVVKSGNSGIYNLKPVIRAIAEAQDGAIKGIVLPVEASPAVYAIQGIDTITSTFTDNTGAFLIRGLEAGSYTLGVSPASGYLETSVENVQVSLGEITDIGTVQLSQ